MDMIVQLILGWMVLETFLMIIAPTSKNTSPYSEY